MLRSAHHRQQRRACRSAPSPVVPRPHQTRAATQHLRTPVPGRGRSMSGTSRGRQALAVSQNRSGRTATLSAPTRPCLRRAASTSETVLGERPRLRARSRTPCGMSGPSRREHATSRPADPEKASSRSARPVTRGRSASTNTPWPVKCKCPRRSNQPHPWLRNSARTASGILSATSTWRTSGPLLRSASAMRRDTCVGAGVDRRLSSTRTRRPPASSKTRSGLSSWPSSTRCRPRSSTSSAKISVVSDSPETIRIG